MIGDILKGLQGETSGQLTKIPGFNSNQLDDVFGIAGDVVTKQVGSQLLGGNSGALMSLFSKGSNNSSANDLQGSIEKGIITKLTSDLGMNRNVASQVVSVLLPSILGKVTGINSKTPDNDLSPLESLFGGGKGKNDIGGMLNKLF